MIVIHVQIKIKPEQRETFLKQARQEMADLRDQQGCVQYQWLGDIGSQDRYTLYEVWQTQADFDAFKESDYFKRLNDVYGDLVAEAPSSHSYRAETLAA